MLDLEWPPWRTLDLHPVTCRPGCKMSACSGFFQGHKSRREAVAVGAVSLAGLGLGLADLSAARAKPVDASAQPAGFGRARSCILVFMWGGPSQLDTWDPKPEAPAEIRGSFGTIETRTPGLWISEHFPRLAGVSNRLAVIRSMTHDDPAHLSTAHRVLTGHLAPTPKSDAAGPSPRDWPHLGSMLARIRGQVGALPVAVSMPWTVAHPAAPGGRAPGQNGGWLGHGFDPLQIDGDPNTAGFRVQGLDLPPGLDIARVASRQELLKNLGGQADPDSWNVHQRHAFNAVTSAQARTAVQIGREDPRLRDRYGRHIHGQCLLLARRLVEAGVSLVTVNWHNDGQNFWDTHGDNFNHLKNRLMPPADQGLSALLDDLSGRGMLEETLVVWVGEFGRTPRITAANAGREHWPRCYSAVMAGGGVTGSQIYGASDHWAAYPARDPVSPEDLGATILHALGVSPEMEIPDPTGRLMQINQGRPLTTLFA